jgi:hypothetical protein
MRRSRPRDGRLRGEPPRRGPTRRAHPMSRPAAPPSREPRVRRLPKPRLRIAGLVLLIVSLLALAVRLA